MLFEREGKALLQPIYINNIFDQPHNGVVLHLMLVAIQLAYIERRIIVSRLLIFVTLTWNESHITRGGTVVDPDLGKMKVCIKNLKLLT